MSTKETPAAIVTACPAGKDSSAPAPLPLAVVADEVALPTKVDVLANGAEKRAEKCAW